MEDERMDRQENEQMREQIFFHAFIKFFEQFCPFDSRVTLK